MNIQSSTFLELQGLSRRKVEGLVLLGCGGDLDQWVKGVQFFLQTDSIIRGNLTEAKAVVTTGGRIDLYLGLPKEVDWGRLAMWRLSFGDCSWLSDYVQNYASQH